MTTISTQAREQRPQAFAEIRELNTDVSGSPYFNEDNAPVNRQGRKWGTFDMAALWISMCACVPTYMLASGMILVGMNWWQAVGTITLANFIVLIPMVLNAHAGTRYGISFPVYCRASFGIRGANIPAILRAMVACGWFGIQTWIGGAAIFKIASVFAPSLNHWSNIPGLGINGAQLICFLIFWGINMVVVYLGIESIRVLLNIKAPLLIFLGLALLGWAVWRAHGFGPMLSQPSAFAPGQPKHGQFFPIFIASLTGNIGFWATLSLNIPDFSRYARSQKAQAIGQAIGLPTTMALYSFIGVAVTSATVVIFGRAIWDPVDLLVRLQNPVVLIIAMAALCIATLATNLAANVVSPANDFSNLAPRWIGFRAGGFITGVLGILIQPWRLMADPNLFIFTWLGGYSSLLGAIGGVLIVDYLLIRRGNLDLPGLYEPDGRYWYLAGFNPIAIVSLVIGVALCVPGFLTTVHLSHFGDTWTSIYNYAWFVSFFAAGICYAAGSMLMRRPNAE